VIGKDIFNKLNTQLSKNSFRWIKSVSLKIREKKRRFHMILMFGGYHPNDDFQRRPLKMGGRRRNLFHGHLTRLIPPTKKTARLISVVTGICNLSNNLKSLQRLGYRMIQILQSRVQNRPCFFHFHALGVFRFVCSLLIRR
jgi:hypothetical protein